MTKAKRDVLEINQFQLHVLKPFYVATFSAAIFFAFMVYGVFFFPDQYSTTTMMLTECEPSTTFPVIVAVILSLIFSLGAFILADRLNARSTEDNKNKNSEKPLLSSLIAGFALLFSVSLLVFILFQKFVMPQIKPSTNLFNISLQPHHIIIVVGGLGAMALIIGLFYWAYGISNKVLGPYDRIIRDLDKIVDGRSRKDLYVRPGDEMFEELVTRINVLIKNQKEHNNDRQSDGI